MKPVNSKRRKTMDNVPVYTIHIDLEECKVLDEDFVFLVDTCLKKDINFEISLADKNNVGFLRLNTAINMFIKDCYKELKDRCIANPYRDEHLGDIVKEFIEYFILYFWHQDELQHSGKYYKFEVFKGGYVFKAYIPISYIDKELFNEYIGLGPDYLMGAKGITNEALFRYILPAFYYNLIYDDLTDNEELLKLQDYMIGLA